MIMGIGQALAERSMSTSANMVRDLSCMSLTTGDECLQSLSHMQEARISGRNCDPLAAKGHGPQVLRATRRECEPHTSTLDVDTADK